MLLNIRGGLGNQIFQISYALNRAKSPDKIFINSNASQFRSDVFGPLGLNEIDSYFFNVLAGGIRKGMNLLSDPNFDLDTLDFLDGYFQKEDLSRTMPPLLRDAVKNALRIDKSLDDKIDLVLHIRGGDYLSGRAKKIYENCDFEYYKRAFSYIKSFVNKDHTLRLYCVTNDAHYAKSVLSELTLKGNINVEVEWYSGDDLDDFSLLARARLAIIPNSTFSLTARLFAEVNSVTVAPDSWYKAGSGLNRPHVGSFVYL